MSILIKKAMVLDASSAWNGKRKDIFVNKSGEIEDYKEQKIKQTIEGEDLCVFPGLCDLQVNFSEPGMEHKETIQTGLTAAAKGGVTAVLQVPNVSPVIDNKEVLTFVKSKKLNSPVDLLVQCAVSHSLKGNELTEILDATDHGADAFGDGYSNIWHSGLFLKALQYLQHTDKVLITQPYDINMVQDGLVHEGEMSTQNGLKGIPSLVETMAISRDLEILKYTGGKLHFAQISSAESVDLIKSAKKQGLNVTCGVSYFHLIKNDQSLNTFDTNHKILPPLRGEKDRKALVKGVKEGIIDVVVSNHAAHEEDAKKLEFNYASFGKIGVQTMFASLKTFTNLSDEILRKVLVENPRKILNKEIPKIEGESKANLMILDQTAYQFTRDDNASLSQNTSEIGEEYKIKIVGIINGTSSQIFK